MLSVLVVLACGPKVPPTPATPAAPVPPDAVKKDFVHTEHGVERPDAYYWLRERDNPEVIAYVEAENAYAEASNAHLANVRDVLAAELLDRIEQTDSDPPVRHGDWMYYSRTEEGLDYEILCRTPAAGGDEQVLLDQNKLAEGTEFFSLGDWEVSPDHTLLAYTTDETGREEYTLRVRDLATGDNLPDTIDNVAGGIAWTSDNQTFFYGTRDATLRPAFIHRHTLGQPDDAQVWHEEDSEYTASTGRTRSGDYVVIASFSATASEFQVLAADDPTGAFEVFSPRHDGHEYSIDHQGDRWLIRTNDCDDDDGAHAKCALNFKVMTAARDARDRSAWKELIAHREDVTIESVQAFADFAVVRERDQGLVQIRILDGSEELHHVQQPADSFTNYSASNPQFDTPNYRFHYTSLVTPWSVVDYHVADRERTVVKVTPVLGGFEADDYVTSRTTCTATDGAEVPMSLVHRADLADGPAPTLLYAYGSYGFAMDPTFRSSRLSYLDRGMVYAIAHVRGGGRSRPRLVRGWQVPAQEEHIHRLHRVCGARGGGCGSGSRCLRASVQGVPHVGAAQVGPHAGSPPFARGDRGPRTATLRCDPPSSG